MVCLDVGYFVCDGGVVGVFACVEVALVSSTRSGKRGRKRSRVFGKLIWVWGVCVCVCVCRVEANGKHYMAGGYVFAPLSFAALEAAGEEA